MPYSPLSIDNFVAEFFDKLDSILVARSGKNPGGKILEAGPDILRIKDPICFAAPIRFLRVYKLPLTEALSAEFSRSGRGREPSELQSKD